MQELPALKPACSSLNAAFGISSSILVRTLLGMDNSWVPLQLWQSHESPFLGSLTIWPVFHSGDLFLLSYVLEQCWCCSVFPEGIRENVVWSGRFSSLIFVMALYISSVVMGPMFICSSSPASMSGGCSTLFPGRRRLKCSFQRSSCSSGLVSIPQSSSRTGLSELDLLPDRYPVIAHSVLVSFFVAASCALDASWSIFLFLSWRGCFFQLPSVALCSPSGSWLLISWTSSK